MKGINSSKKDKKKVNKLYKFSGLIHINLPINVSKNHIYHQFL